MKNKVFDFVAKIPKGKVVTYGMIARIFRLNTPRVVGRYLHQNTDPKNIPCHRVVFSNGELSPKYVFGGYKLQRQQLEKEGVIFKKNRVDLQKSLYKINIDI